jgi:hypothetical protein
MSQPNEHRSRDLCERNLLLSIYTCKRKVAALGRSGVGESRLAIEEERSGEAAHEETTARKSWISSWICSLKG